jgi:hypothetical protein
MKSVLSRVAVVMLLGFVLPSAAAEKQNTPVALEKKLLGVWKGQAACQGDLLVRADGTYKRIHAGPGNVTYAGTWAVLWEALPPTLVMTCKTSDDPDLIGKKEDVKLITLDDTNLEVRYTSGDFVWRYVRIKKVDRQGDQEKDE